MAASRAVRAQPDHLTRRDRERGALAAIVAAAPLLDRSHGINRLPAKVLVALLLDEGRAMKTATDRAAAAIEAAETIFANEMGATLDLSPAARAALSVTIAAAIKAAVVEEQERLICAQ